MIFSFFPFIKFFYIFIPSFHSSLHFLHLIQFDFSFTCKNVVCLFLSSFPLNFSLYFIPFFMNWTILWKKLLVLCCFWQGICFWKSSKSENQIKENKRIKKCNILEKVDSVLARNFLSKLLSAKTRKWSEEFAI